VATARHVPFADHEDPAGAVIGALRLGGLASSRLGVEMDHMFFPPRIAESIEAGFPGAAWGDGSGIVDELRIVKSPREIAYTRQAAAITDLAMRTAVERAGVGVNEKEIAAEIYRTMILAGSEYPSFVPFVRSTETIGQEHGTWRDRALQRGDVLFMELSACVRRYNAPMSRTIYIGRVPEGVREAEPIILEAMGEIERTLRPGALTGEVYAAWQAVIDRVLGHSNYRRHHCGYTLGIGFPPSWVGGSVVVGIRPNGTIPIRAGMVFHVVSWAPNSGLGNYGVTDTAIVTDKGADILTSAARHVTVR
jgi:Xaa-Pro dipeptidase